MLGRNVLAHGQIQLVVGHVATRVEDDSLAVVDNEELVGLHRLRFIGYQVGKHHTAVMGIFVKLDWHDGDPKDNERTIALVGIPLWSCSSRTVLI